MAAQSSFEFVCVWVGGWWEGGCDVIFNITEGVTTLAQNLKLLKPERERSREKKSKNRRLNASNNRRKRACIIFRSLGGELVELCYEPDI